MMKCIVRVQLAAALLATWFGSIAGFAADDLDKTFAKPPESVRPHTYWYWMDNNISREGITADLEAMKRTGIGGVFLFNIIGYVPGGTVKVLSPAWKEMMRHAIHEAGRLGLEINLNNSMAGWSSSGGPWITPELGMQRLTWSETEVEGGQTFDGPLAQPPFDLT